MSNKIDIAYKVVNNELKSVVAKAWIFETSINKNLWQVQYKVGQLIYPNVKNTKLLAFSTLQQAAHFQFRYKFIESIIYKCYVLNPKKSGPIAGMNNIDKIWQLYQHKQKYTHITNPAPSGTLWCEAIQLIEQIS